MTRELDGSLVRVDDLLSFEVDHQDCGGSAVQHLRKVCNGVRRAGTEVSAVLHPPQGRAARRLPRPDVRSD
ncbi:hypothetical protein GCM10009608_14390 [Pseudonocardia alaniniphila]